MLMSASESYQITDFTCGTCSISLRIAVISQASIPSTTQKENAPVPNSSRRIS